MGFPSEWLKFAPKPRELTGDEKWNVFLSYRSVNRSWVVNLYDVLRGLGHKVFLDQFALEAGDQLVTRLENALGASQAGILVWSNATRDSDWVRREYIVLESLAEEKTGFKFVPVRLDNSKLPLFAKSRVFLDFSSYPDGPNGGELLRLLHAVVGAIWSEEAERFAREQEEAAQEAAAKIKAAIRNDNPERLVRLFEDGGLPWQTSAALGCSAAEGLTKLGRNDEAIQLLEQLEQRFPKAIRPKQLRALALARRGKGDDLMDAQDILGVLYALEERDPETLGIYARTWMDRYKKSGKASDLTQSRNFYAEAFERTQDDYYTGINAAAKSLLLGGDENVQKANDYAQRVQQIVGTEPHPGDYWMTASAAEALLIQKKYADAGRLYKAAVDGALSEVGSHQSTWSQACLLMGELQPTDEERALIRQAFPEQPECDQLMAKVP